MLAPGARKEKEHVQLQSACIAYVFIKVLCSNTNKAVALLHARQQQTGACYLYKQHDH